MSSDAYLDANGQRIQSVTTPTDYATYYVRRNVSHSGGTPGYVNAGFRADVFTSVGATDYNWAIVGVVYNYSTGGQNVGGYFQGNKQIGAGPTWGLTAEVIDWNTTAPVSGVVGQELDVRGNTLDPNNCRIGLDIVYSRQGLTGANMECTYGLRIQDAGDHLGAFLKTGIGFALGCNVGIGLDLTKATIVGSAIALAAGQAITFDTTVTPNQFTGSALGIDHLANHVMVNRLLATGGLQVGSVQVVGSRQNVTGSRASGAALVSLLAALGASGHGLITDNTTA